MPPSASHMASLVCVHCAAPMKETQQAPVGMALSQLMDMHMV